MLDEIFAVHSNVVKKVGYDKKRYAWETINWNSRAQCITGGRGTGKTTLILQYYKEKYNNPEKCLYISGDNILVSSKGLFSIAMEYFSLGGDGLIIDEVHKYPNWSQEVKNIYDTFGDKKLILSGSSTVDLKKARYDLSRRVVYNRLDGLSFREFLNFAYDIKVEKVPLEAILRNHYDIASDILGKGPILKYFNEYLTYGYYPFFLEELQDFNNKLFGIIEKVLYEDIGAAYNLPQAKIPVLKKMLLLIATSHPFVPNIDGMATELGISRPTVYNYIDILSNAGLISLVRPGGKGSAAIRKPGKIYFENTNLLNVIAGSIRTEAQIGTLRETFFNNQLSHLFDVSLHKKADMVVDDKLIFEIGGPSKKTDQIKNEENAYLAVDGVEYGSPKRIPLYLFGLLY
jgi:predicted AAA+ superfamily ATPase